jgi:2,4-dienoyl-CoA reductase-like NADH-dependent reductase (Old Yellow Enzyme family)
MLASSAPRRYFFLGVNTGFVKNKLPDERCFEFYSRRSGNGLYCSVVGNVVIPGGFGTNKNTAEISNASVWRLLAQSIASRGAVPGIQLTNTWDGYSGMRSFVAGSPDEEIARCRSLVSSISRADVARLFDALEVGTKLAVQAGFRHIQLHAAHGYLFSLLIDSRLFAFALSTRNAISEWADRRHAEGVETSLRFSLRTGCEVFDEMHRDDFLRTIAKIPVNFLDVSSGFYNIDKRLIYPSLNGIIVQRARETVALAKRHPNARFIISGKSTRVPEANLPSNVDVGICRDLIANPDFLTDRMKGCVTAMKCHYFSRGERHITCGQWPK